MTQDTCAYCKQPLPADADRLWHQECADMQHAKRSPSRKTGYVPDSWTWVPQEKRGPKEKRGR